MVVNRLAAADPVDFAEVVLLVLAVGAPPASLSAISEGRAVWVRWRNAGVEKRTASPFNLFFGTSISFPIMIRFLT